MPKGKHNAEDSGLEQLYEWASVETEGGRHTPEDDLQPCVPPKFVLAKDVKGSQPYTVKSSTPLKTRFRIKPIYFQGPKHKGSRTRVFAWLSLPIFDQDSPKQTVPGVVLVHGGGGTAYKEWCERWAIDAGFASISIAVEGQTDVALNEQDPETNMLFERVACSADQESNNLCGTPGPFRKGRAYGDWENPLEDQWMFHAVADALLAAQLLRSLPNVNKRQVGILGVSWGSVITSTAIGFDSRNHDKDESLFAFAIMGYGCGSMSNSLSHIGRQIRMKPRGAQSAKELYDSIWDPVLRLPRIQTTPTMWISWPQEFHFPLPDQANNYNKMKPPVMTLIIPQLGHGHKPVYGLKEQYEFANSVLKMGDYHQNKKMFLWAEQVNVPDPKDIDAQMLKAKVQGEPYIKFQVEFKLVSTKQFAEATLVSTHDSIDMISSERKWNCTQIHSVTQKTADQPRCLWIIQTEVATETTGWYILLKTKDNLRVSSRFHQISPQVAKS